MNRSKLGTGIALSLVLAVLTLGCASSGAKNARFATNSTEQIDALGSDLAQAREADVDVLSPTWFARAQSSYDAARVLRDRGGAVSSVMRHVTEGRTQIATATEFASVSAQMLPEAVRARGDARKAGAASDASYAEVEERFLALTRGVENDGLNRARRDMKGVESAFREIELAAIKRNAMDRVTDLIAKAKSEGAATLVPNTLADVEKRARELSAFIDANRYASDETTRRAAEAVFFANRLVHLTTTAATLRGKKPEELALENEAVLSSVGERLGLPDFRNQSRVTQLRNVENGVDEVRRDRDFLVNRVELLRSQADQQKSRISFLQGENEQERLRVEKLESERRFNQRFAEVSAYFTADEAEVYKQDRRLVIRLRAVRFPTGSSVVLPDSYPLMAKVQRAIRAFSEPLVIVEGHTDSTGSTEVNDRVSQSRADAVKAYMVANNTVRSDRISAVGKGFSEPIASDRTSEGRAQNRRIDVIIDSLTPDITPLPPVAATGGGE